MIGGRATILKTRLHHRLPLEESPGIESKMILSHKYKFIFLKTAKAAGTSIEIALSKHLGDNDIITPISPPDEIIRRQLGYRGPQNFYVPLRCCSMRDIAGTLLTFRRKKFYNHMSCQEVRSLVGDGVWNTYYKFCIERNPFDRVVSLYYWIHRREPRPTLAQFLEQPEIELLSRRGLELYTTQTGAIAVDRVGRYENLIQDLEEIRRAIGIPEPLELPHAKASHRSDKRHYSDVIDELSRSKIAARFQREMELFGYRF